MQAGDTLIGDIKPPEALMATLTDRKIAEEQKKTYDVQKPRRSSGKLVRETANADIQQQMVRAEQGRLHLGAGARRPREASGRRSRVVPVARGG